MLTIDDAICGSVESPGGQQLKLILVSNSLPQLRSLARTVAGLGDKGESEILENVRFDNPGRSLLKLQLKVSRAGQAERLSRIPLLGEMELIVWEGDSEYWQECVDKLDGLIEAGRGHQDLLVRGSVDQQCVVSYCE